MRIIEQEDESVGTLPLTPLIDVVFLLLIFFLTTTSFYNPEKDIKTRPPESKDVLEPSDISGKIIVNVRRAGVYVVKARILSLQEVRQMLQRAARGPKAPSVIIRGDRKAYFESIMNVVSGCIAAGIDDYSFATEIPRN